MGYAQYYSIVMRTTLYNTTYNRKYIENHTKSNITNLLTEVKKAIELVMKTTKVTITFVNIRTPKSTYYYLLYDKSHSKTYHTTIILFSILLQILASQAKK